MSRRQDKYDEGLREHIDRGMLPDEARLEAIRTFGNPSATSGVVQVGKFAHNDRGLNAALLAFRAHRAAIASINSALRIGFEI
jgi:hypothetical protein